jgi:hypothetical protein
MEEYNSNGERRNVLRFRDFEMDEDDFHVIDNILSYPRVDQIFFGEIDTNRIYTVSDAVLYGMVKVDQEGNNNESKRITGISTEFLEKWKIQPNYIKRHCGAITTIYTPEDQTSSIINNYNNNIKKRDHIHTKRNIIKFREFEIDEDDFHTMGMILSNQGNLNKGDSVRTVASAVMLGKIKSENDEDDNKSKRVTYFGLRLYRNTTLPKEIMYLTELKTLDLTNWIELKSLPDDISKMQNLELIVLVRCRNLDSITAICNVVTLKELNIATNSKLTSLPSNFGKLVSLETLVINLVSLKKVPTSIKNLNVKRLCVCDYQNGVDKVDDEDDDDDQEEDDSDKVDDEDDDDDQEEDDSEDQVCDEIYIDTIDGIVSLCDLTFLEVSVKNLVHFKEDAFGSKLEKLVLEWNVYEHLDATSLFDLPPLPSLEDLKINYAGWNVDNRNHPARFHTNWLTTLPMLRKCEISGRSVEGYPLVSLSDIRKLESVEELNLRYCQLDSSIDTEAIIASTTTTTTTTPMMITKKKLSSLREFQLWDCYSNDMFSFHLDDLGLCMNMRKFHIYQNSHRRLRVGISYNSSILFPSIQDVSFDNCDFEFISTPLPPPSSPPPSSSPLSFQQQQQDDDPPIQLTIPLENLKNVNLERCKGLFPILNKDIIQNLPKFELSSLEIFRFRFYRTGMTNDQLEILISKILHPSSCPNIKILDLTGSDITEISSTIISQIPPKLLTLDLSMNPIMESITGRDSLCKLLDHVKHIGHLGCVHFQGRNTEDETNDSLPFRKNLGHKMGLNRAKSKVLLNQPIEPPALWTTIIQNASRAFKKDSYDDFICIEENQQSDAIYNMLQERVAMDIIFRHNNN